MRVCVQDIREEAAHRVTSSIGALAVAPLIFDVSDRDASLAAAATLESREGPLSLLWINAGVGVGSPLIRGKPHTIEWAFSVNALGVIWTAQAFCPLLSDPHGPRHVGVTASTAALRPPTGNFPLYATTKHATFAIAEALRGELAVDGIGTTILCPGLLNTNIWDGARARPDRFGGPSSMDPKIASLWRNARDPALMWPHIKRMIETGGGYLVCATDEGDTINAFDQRTRDIRSQVVDL